MSQSAAAELAAAVRSLDFPHSGPFYSPPSSTLYLLPSVFLFMTSSAPHSSPAKLIAERGRPDAHRADRKPEMQEV